MWVAIMECKNYFNQLINKSFDFFTICACFQFQPETFWYFFFFCCLILFNFHRYFNIRISARLRADLLYHLMISWMNLSVLNSLYINYTGWIIFFLDIISKAELFTSDLEKFMPKSLKIFHQFGFYCGLKECYVFLLRTTILK